MKLKSVIKKPEKQNKEKSIYCICESEMVINKIIAKVEYHMNSIIQGFIENMQTMQTNKQSNHLIRRRRKTN